LWLSRKHSDEIRRHQRSVHKKIFGPEGICPAFTVEPIEEKLLRMKGDPSFAIQAMECGME